MPTALATFADLQARASEGGVLAAFDDSNAGIVTGADPAIIRLLRDATSYVLSFLRVKYDITLLIAMGAEALPNEVVRLTLDAAEYYAARRHPEWCRQNKNWKELKAVLDEELHELVSGKRRLDIVGSPEPASGLETEFVQTEDVTSAGEVISLPRRFSNMGDF